MSWPVILIGLAILFGLGVIYSYGRMREDREEPRSEIVYVEDGWLPWDWTSGWAGNYVNAGGWWPHDRNNYRPHRPHPHPGPRPGPHPAPGPRHMLGPGGTQRMLGPDGTQRASGAHGRR